MLTAAVDVNHIKKSTYALQITAVSLYRCLLDAYEKQGGTGDVFDWAEKNLSENVATKYWLTVLQFELKFLTFIRSIREGNFILYVLSLQALMIWFFILDKYNYAR